MTTKNSPSEIFFHLGMPKTASTFLQVNVFPLMPGVKYFKKHDYTRYEDFTPDRKGKFLFSCEKDEDLHTEFERIVSLHPDAKVMIVFRRHGDWLVSKYKYYIRKWGFRPFDEYFSTEGKGERFNVGKHLYSDTVACLEHHFPGRYLLLNFEQLRKDPDAFVERIYDFMGISEPLRFDRRKVKTAFSNRQLVVVRRFNARYPYRKLHTGIKLLDKVHLLWCKLTVHTVALVARFMPVDTSGFEKEIQEIRSKGDAIFAEDWKRFSGLWQSKAEGGAG